MNKRKVIICCIFVFIAVFVMILCVKCNKNEKNLQDEDEQYYNETLNAITINAKVETTVLKKKTIEISAFQKAEIIIDKIVESGDLEIELLDIQNNRIKAQNDTNEQDVGYMVFEIPEGTGKCTLSIFAKEFIGKCNIMWNIEDYDNSELFTSTMGYELQYDSNKFNVIYEQDNETFVYKKNENIYLKIQYVSKENAESIKRQLYEKAEQSGDCQIENSHLTGKYTTRVMTELNLVKRNLIFELDDKSLLILEICENKNTEKEKVTNEYIKRMIESFKYM